MRWAGAEYRTLGSRHENAAISDHFMKMPVADPGLVIHDRPIERLLPLIAVTQYSVSRITPAHDWWVGGERVAPYGQPVG